MSVLVFALVLAAAVFHASWNAAVKSSGDRLVSMAVVLGTCGLIGLPILVMLPLPEAESWPYIYASAVIHLIYGLALAKMFDSGDLSHTYPIARGSAPILVAVLAAVFVGEWPSAMGIVAIFLICVGIISFAALRANGAHLSSKGTPQALFVGLIISLYTFADGAGVRLSGNVLSFISWMFFLTALLVVPVAAWMRRDSLTNKLTLVWKTSMAGGVIAALAYGIVIWAMSIAPMAHVAALRETSVVIAALIGTRLLGERGGRWRVAAASVVVSGVVALQLSG